MQPSSLRLVFKCGDSRNAIDVSVLIQLQVLNPVKRLKFIDKETHGAKCVWRVFTQRRSLLCWTVLLLLVKFAYSFFREAE